MISCFGKYKSVIILTFIVVMIVVCLLFVVNNISYDDGSIDVSYSSSNEFVISNVLPMTDAVGKVIDYENNQIGTTGFLEFEVKSVVDSKVRYEVYLTKESLDSEVPVKFVKVFLTDQNDIALNDFNASSVPTYYDLKISDSDPGGKMLFSGALKNKESRKFRLRMWVADTYELTSNPKLFSVKINVKVK